MKLRVQTILILFLFGSFVPKINAQLYYPPSGNSTWDTLQPSRFGWCTERIDELYDYLGKTNTKAFILLKDGKIVLEKYYGTFTKDSLHTWNSAGKTMTSALIGIAQNDNLINLNEPTSTYLGLG